MPGLLVHVRQQRGFREDTDSPAWSGHEEVNEDNHILLRCSVFKCKIVISVLVLVSYPSRQIMWCADLCSGKDVCMTVLISIVIKAPDSEYENGA